ncbi:histidine phosphatase family protein [Vreelandella sulfidaeris]|uniref:histidine phosphatase family protein n=1 Tax=Vreelandella sulfidaeris TaxID=115553 RepID=UPI0035E95C9D
MSNTLQPLSDHWRNRYLLMRHGHSQANQQGLIISSPERGIQAFGLSAIGEQQMAQLVVAWTWPIPTQVVHSDFLRTTQTAARVTRAFKLEMTADKRLRERYFGDFDGQADEYYPDVWAWDADDAEHGHHGVESVSSVAARMRAVIEGLEQQYTGETILLVSHGDPLQILLTALANKPLSQHREQPALLPASVTLL